MIFMRIKQLKLEHFKCFKTEKTFDFGKITLLTGANNSGKSTVIQALLSAIQSNGFPLNYSPNGKYVNLGDFKEVTHHGNKNSIKLNIKTSAELFPFKKNKMDIEMQTCWREDPKSFLPILQKAIISTLSLSNDTDELLEQDSIYHKELVQTVFIERSNNADLYNVKIQYSNAQFAESEHYKFKENTLIKRALSLEKLDPIAWEPKLIGKEITFELTLKALLFYQNQFLRFPEYGSKLQDGYFKYIGAFRQPPQLSYWETNNYTCEINTDGTGYIDQIVQWENTSDDKMIELASALQSLGLLEGVKINRLNGGKFEVLVKLFQNGSWTSLTNVGYGVSQLLPILVTDLQIPLISQQTTFFLAEPETHLHPSIQSNLAQYFINQINIDNKKNYIIETHSEYFLNRIRLAIVKGELSISDIQVYFLESIKNDTNVYNIHFTKTGEIHGAPATFFETYSMDAMQIFTNAFKE
jgi:predicted ATPase